MLYQAFVSVVGMGDDINGMIRTCPPPRDGESELACQAEPTRMSFYVCYSNIQPTVNCCFETVFGHIEMTLYYKLF